MRSKSSYISVFERVFDVVVVGSGYSGVAAALKAAADGRDVLMVATGGDLLWESGRAFAPNIGAASGPIWAELVSAIRRVGGATDEWVDGAIAEVVATDALAESRCHSLYYARPIHIERQGEVAASAIFATRQGPRRLSARRWIDATESGELIRLASPGACPNTPTEVNAYAALQHPDWAGLNLHDVADVALIPSGWESERILRFTLEHGEKYWRSKLLDALDGLERSLGPELGRASVTHMGFVPVASYGGGATLDTGIANLVAASPSFTPGSVISLGDRFELGTLAAELLSSTPEGDPHVSAQNADIPPISFAEEISADVCVVGCGTGGSLAVMAAERAGAQVIGIEPMPLLGGIGTGGGIHVYWFGVPGGLQTEIDARTKEIMKAYGGGPFGDGPFNPWAKAIAIEEAVANSGAQVLFDAMMYDVTRSGEQVDSVSVATANGPLLVKATSFVDGTGDGDLCAMAEVEYSLGREEDGLLHAFSQSAGRLQLLHERPRMDVVNFDAGFCDPTDTEDLTRARIQGIRQYLLPGGFTEWTRPTYIAPVLGVRQGRQFATDYVLTLDDLISRKRFSDVVGFTAAHFDNHATDIEFESDEAVFWEWANRQFSTPVACETNYRMLLPHGLSNVWIGSRCLGATQDAQYVVRMQRDIQRIGEVAGFAAALAAQGGFKSRSLPIGLLQDELTKTKALVAVPRALETGFGMAESETVSAVESGLGPDEKSGDIALTDLALARLQTADGVQQSTLVEALSALDEGIPGAAVWWLYRNEGIAREQVRSRLQSPRHMVSWLAACTLAMWGDPAAEPRLLAAVQNREFGFDRESGGMAAGSRRSMTPMDSNRVVPNWLCALTLLRRCATSESLAAIQSLIDLPVSDLDTLATVAITLERTAARGVLTADDRVWVSGMLDELRNHRPQGVLYSPDRKLGLESENDLRNSTDSPSLAASPASTDAALALQKLNVKGDRSWQLDLALSRARLAIGEVPEFNTSDFANDDRAFVRRAFSELPSPMPNSLGTTVMEAEPSAIALRR